MNVCNRGSPGPAYALNTLTGYNNHDYTKSRAPAFSLGLKPVSNPLQPTPGPYNIGNVTRNGRGPYLGWTIESVARRKVKPFGPSPLDYFPQMPYQSPAFSLGLKLHTRDRSFGPGAADYYPQYGPGYPAYTMGMALRDRPKWVPPGPLPETPLERYKQRAPAFSLGLKPPLVHRGTAGPGPAYLPGRVCRNHIPHAYSFGLKHSGCSPPMITFEDNDL